MFLIIDLFYSRFVLVKHLTTNRNVIHQKANIKVRLVSISFRNILRDLFMIDCKFRTRSKHSNRRLKRWQAKTRWMDIYHERIGFTKHGC